MRRNLALGIWLVVVWVALWEGLTVANVLSGTVIALLLLLVFPPGRLIGDRPTTRATLRPLAAIKFHLYFAWKLIEANAIVAWEVVTPRNRINEGIVAVPMRSSSDLVVTVVANAITLTPGTLTVDVSEDPTVLYVHVLHLHDIDRVRHDVGTLERLVIEAFADDQTVATISEVDP